MNESDLRVIKTEQSIEKAFLQLLYQKPYRAITVQDILQAALINRSTFYRHYSNKTALAEKLVQDFRQTYEDFLYQRFSNTQPEQLAEFIDGFLDFIFTQKHKILALWRIHTDSIHLYDDLLVLIKTQFITTGKNLNKLGNLDYQGYMYANIVLAHLKYALEHDMPLSVITIRQELAYMFATASMQQTVIQL